MRNVSILVATMGLAACASLNHNDDIAEQSRLLLLSCDNGAALSARLDESEAAVTMDGETIVLPRADISQTESYTNGRLTLIVEDPGARVAVGRRAFANCENMAESDPWRSAIDRDVDFRAGGNEPGWNVELAGDRLSYVGDYGETEITAPLTARVVDPSSEARQWDARSGSHSITLMATPRTCRDTMADRVYGETVTIIVDGESHQGCGWTLSP